ncbi:MAG: nuclear transport factor 2 family protein [Chitinophagales bacterium]|nr:nuclear transport factor 2 family protein [Chitinophagaceae bacterium]MCB9064050.1 nuclear transport factor 2 family protein [Chitinophagales bacterium]
MRLIAIISLLVFAASCGNAPEQTKVEEQKPLVDAIVHNADDVKKAAYAYNDAMMAADTVALNSLLHDNLSYGHSNGWVETKADQKVNLYNGTIKYHKIDQPELDVIMNDHVATVRGNGIFDVDYKGNEHMMFDLNVMQTWVYENDRWQMLNRQSVANK